MRVFGRRTVSTVLLSATLAVCLIVVGPHLAVAVEAGEPAPDFRLASTTGLDISLSDFKGTKWVFLEFYALDFSPA
jgi:hypothetical protein